MKTAKQIVTEMIPTLPDDCSMEEIIYHLDVIRKVEEGIKSLDEGKGIPHEEVERRFARWLKR